MQRTQFRQPARPEKAPMAWPSPVKGGTPARISDAYVSQPKPVKLSKGKAEQLHKGKVVQLGCMCCSMAMNTFTPGVELHHMRAGQGWGRGDWMTLIPLCAIHHRGDLGVHGLGTKGFPKLYGFTEQDMLDKTLSLIGYVPVAIELGAP